MTEVTRTKQLARQYRLKPKAIEATFNYFARQIRRDQGDDGIR